jgi:hypothetical protein
MKSEYAANLSLQTSHNARQVLTTRVHRVTHVEPMVRSHFWIALIGALVLKALSTW